MANFIETIVKYSDQALDLAMRVGARSEILRTGEKMVQFNFDNARTVKVYTVTMDGLSNYHRVNNAEPAENYVHIQPDGQGLGDGYPKANLKGTWTEYTLPYDRGAQFQIDEMDDEETASLSLTAAAKHFNEQEVIPEQDALTFSDIAAATSAELGNRVSETITEDNALESLDNAIASMDENEVPESDQIIFANPQFIKALRRSTELTKFLNQETYELGNVNYTIAEYMGRPVISVPSVRFFTDVLLGDNGYYKTANSKNINYLIVSRPAIVPIVKLAKFKVFTPEQVQDFDGYKVNCRIYHGNFIPKMKRLAFYASISEAAPSARELNVLTAAGTATNTFVVKEAFTKPAGINYANIVYQATAFTVGAKVEIDGTNVKAANVGVETTETTATTAYFAALDSNGVVVATTSKTVALNKKS